MIFNTRDDLLFLVRVLLLLHHHIYKYIHISIYIIPAIIAIIIRHRAYQ